MDKINLTKQIEIITQIRDRLHSNNGSNVRMINFTLEKEEIDAMIDVLDAGITYYNFTRALQQKPNKDENKNG